ncbi:hypothetical protein Val02_81920 [Virgisporangium aliadipatigenens]|uniref:Uncharacterized protein n=1 Tax=Virgisporangium aliadipatigenens TaxID=741659 RepID=A0A8J3YX06_9ACTN|nr:hypothetical protein [Virgisporangium aliadipatigenens]GIJ51306.1 hypothetical protein Val02_81920 [Virgisporangium aliadipatigenens]
MNPILWLARLIAGAVLVALLAIVCTAAGGILLSYGVEDIQQ